jgi:hypothetical protein
LKLCIILTHYLQFDFEVGFYIYVCWIKIFNFVNTFNFKIFKCLIRNLKKSDFIFFNIQFCLRKLFLVYMLVVIEHNINAALYRNSYKKWIISLCICFSFFLFFFFLFYIINFSWLNHIIYNDMLDGVIY